jgi:hypothetical protein
MKGLIQDKGVDMEILEGFLSVLLGDIEAEDSIKILSEQLDIDSKSLIELIDLIAPDTKNFPNILMNLLSTHSSKEE